MTRAHAPLPLPSAGRRWPPSRGVLARCVHLSALCVCLLALCGACSPGPSQKTGSQTNWLVSCEKDADCGGLDCLCGVCTSACSLELECAALEGTTCVAESDPGAIALCGGRTPVSGLCLEACASGECTSGGGCLAGVCDAARAPDARISVDADLTYQTLVGFGASLSYADDAIAAHPQGELLFDAMFTESGFDMLRIRSRFDGDNPGALRAASEIAAAGATRLGVAPRILLTAGSPPPALKANGSRICAGSLDTCTLARDTQGAFAYAPFAEHWRATLDAYAAAGIVPDYLSIQNNPDWSPPEATPLEACRLLPAEGEEEVMLESGPTLVSYPGYREALSAVLATLADGAHTPQIVAPEVGSLEAVTGYAEQLDSASYDALAFHLYYTIDPADVDAELFRAVREIARASGHPTFQTEMRAEGLATAVLAHYSLTEADAAVYLQNDFVVVAGEDNPSALLRLGANDFERQLPYYALQHFARDTEPGWTRVQASADAEAPLVSAWRAPDGSALSLVLINPGATDLWLRLEPATGSLASFTRSRQRRTVFEGVERAAELGPVGTDGMVSLPAGSVLTVSLDSE